MKPFVLCHMEVSMDGKIDGPYQDYPYAQDAGNDYDFLTDLPRSDEAMACGKNTVRMYFASDPIDLSPYRGDKTDSGKDQFFPLREGERYVFVFDRSGSLFYKENTYPYGAQQNRIVEVITSKAKPEYLAYLKSMEIPYLIGGKDDLDLPLVLEKMAKLFSIREVLLTGGAEINGSFLKAGLVDEISLVMVPYIDGDPVHKAFAEGKEILTRYQFEKAEPYKQGGVRLLFRKAEQG